MSKGPWLLVIACAGLLLHAQAAYPMTVTLPEVDLPLATRTLLSELVCSPHKAPVQRITGYSFATGSFGALVECARHSEHHGHKVFAQAECKGRDSSWECPEQWLNVTFEAKGYPPSVRLDDVPIDEAVTIVEYLQTVPVKQFAKLWLLERGGPDKFLAETSGYRYELSRRETAQGRTYGITRTWLVDR